MLLVCTCIFAVMSTRFAQISTIVSQGTRAQHLPRLLLYGGQVASHVLTLVIASRTCADVRAASLRFALSHFGLAAARTLPPLAHPQRPLVPPPFSLRISAVRKRVASDVCCNFAEGGVFPETVPVVRVEGYGWQ